jgi:hypothetical protein
MLNPNLRRNRKQQPEELQFMDVGDLVRRNEDGAVGILRTIDLSPYFAEERAGVVRGYVVFGDSADWMLQSEISLVAKATVLAALAS